MYFILLVGKSNDPHRPHGQDSSRVPNPDFAKHVANGGSGGRKDKGIVDSWIPTPRSPSGV